MVCVRRVCSSNLLERGRMACRVASSEEEEVGGGFVAAKTAEGTA